MDELNFTIDKRVQINHQMRGKLVVLTKLILTDREKHLQIRKTARCFSPCITRLQGKIKSMLYCKQEAVMKVGARQHRTDPEVNSPHNEFWDLLTKKREEKSYRRWSQILVSGKVRPITSLFGCDKHGKRLL